MCKDHEMQSDRKCKIYHYDLKKTGDVIGDEEIFKAFTWVNVVKDLKYIKYPNVEAPSEFNIFMILC